MTERSHAGSRRTVRKSTPGCDECLREGKERVHLRLCRNRGHSGGCDEPPRKHAIAHSRGAGHLIIEGYDAPEGRSFRYVTTSPPISAGARCRRSDPSRVTSERREAGAVLATASKRKC